MEKRQSLITNMRDQVYQIQDHAEEPLTEALANVENISQLWSQLTIRLARKHDNIQVNCHLLLLSVSPLKLSVSKNTFLFLITSLVVY